MPSNEQEKPWFGKRCGKCNAPINYAYKGAITGWCGKCTDELRREFKEDLRRELAAEGAVGAGPSAPRGGGGRLVVGLVLGLALGAGGAVAAAAFAPEVWSRVVSLVPRVAAPGRGAGGDR